MRKNLLIAICTVFLFYGSVLAQGAKQEAKKDGWWLKVNAKESQMIGFYVGANSHSYGFWRVWNPGQPAEFDVPDEFRTGATLYVLAQTTSGAKCRFCIMHKAKGVKHFEFDLEQDSEVTPAQEDKMCK